MDNIKEKISSFISQDADIEVVDVRVGSQGGRMRIQVLLDKEGGISMEDLTEVNRRLSKAMDQWDMVSDSYLLEVSSAGLERPLTKLEHFKRFHGKKVKIVLKEPLVEKRRKLTGLIAGVEGDEVSIEDDAQVLNIDFSNIKKANLV